MSTTTSQAAPPGYRLFHIVAMLFVASLVVGNTVAVKIITVWGLAIPAGILCFPLSYILGDVLTEVYGYQKTRNVIWWGFFAIAFMSLIYFLASKLDPAPFWTNQEAFDSIFSFIPRIGVASFVAYLIGSFANSIVMSVMKKKTGGKMLWTRTIGSTIVGEGLDSVIFNTIAFYGIFPTADLWVVIGTGFMLKTAYEIVATPFTYLAVNWMKRKEQEDRFDHNVSYNPF